MTNWWFDGISLTFFVHFKAAQASLWCFAQRFFSTNSVISSTRLLPHRVVAARWLALPIRLTTVGRKLSHTGVTP
jgi:hypothetical protein